MISIVLLSISIELGYRVGLKSQHKWKDAELGGGGIVQTSLLALLGLMLAFTYSAVVSRHDARKSTVLVEVNALGSAFLRADHVAEPGRTDLRKVLLDYARTRVLTRELVGTSKGREEHLHKTLALQDKIWPTAMQAIGKENPDPLDASLAAAINDLIDAHTFRYAADFDKLPAAVILMLLLISAASLSVAGYNAGIQGCISRWRMGTFVLVLTGVIVLILDFDRPVDGVVQVSQFSINAVITDMKTKLTQ